MRREVPWLFAVAVTVDGPVDTKDTLCPVEAKSSRESGLVLLYLLLASRSRGWESGSEEGGVGSTSDQLATTVVNCGPF